MTRRRVPTIVLVLLLLVLSGIAAYAGALQQAWEHITGEGIGLTGTPAPATQGKLSPREIETILSYPPQRSFELFTLAMLGNRGVETARVIGLLEQYADDADEKTQYWAVEGIAIMGTPDTIPSCCVSFMTAEPARNASAQDADWQSQGPTRSRSA